MSSSQIQEFENINANELCIVGCPTEYYELVEKKFTPKKIKNPIEKKFRLMGIYENSKAAFERLINIEKDPKQFFIKKIIPFVPNS